MKTFTFFLKDESIHESEGKTAADAFRALCYRLNKSWAWLRAEVIDCLEYDGVDN